MTPERWEKALLEYLKSTSASFVSDLLMHSTVEQEGETLVLICPTHFEMLLTDNRQREAFSIVRSALFEAQSYILRFEEGAADFSPYGLQQQRHLEAYHSEQKILRQSAVAQILEQSAHGKEIPLTQTSSH